MTRASPEVCLVTGVHMRSVLYVLTIATIPLSHFSISTPLFFSLIFIFLSKDTSQSLSINRLRVSLLLYIFYVLYLFLTSL